MTQNAAPLDITNIPVLRHLVEEMRTTRKPRLLKQDREAVALLLPLETSTPPEALWQHYNAKQVRQALAKSTGTLTGVDRVSLLADIRQSRSQQTHRPI